MLQLMCSIILVRTVQPSGPSSIISQIHEKSLSSLSAFDALGGARLTFGKRSSNVTDEAELKHRNDALNSSNGVLVGQEFGFRRFDGLQIGLFQFPIAQPESSKLEINLNKLSAPALSQRQLYHGFAPNPTRLPNIPPFSRLRVADFRLVWQVSFGPFTTLSTMPGLEQYCDGFCRCFSSRALCVA
jgi:hypothetical protein